MSSAIDRVSIWLDRLKKNDSLVTLDLWSRYYDRLRQIAKKKIQRYGHGVAFDDEDVALSALDSFCRNVKKGQYPNLNSSEDIWCLLVVIAQRKANDRAKNEFAAKRGGKANCSSTDEKAEIADSDLQPDSRAELEDLTDHLFTILDDAELQNIALQKLSGETNSQIAEQMGRTRQTVQRKLRLIRDIWLTELDK